ncbi:MAG: cell division protein ZapA [Gammaproteobacteria bacterium]|nr:cell division protein ZapA [Gammaproteobacteria bacterium]MDH5652501.1 cell division protein ZapA [Gammaproteobacteria bacterium]
MSDQTTNVKIMGKEYLIACPDDEKQDLIRSADYLDRKMREIRDTGKIIGTDRIAVMAALNIAHELLNQQSTKTVSQSAIAGRIRSLQSKIEDALYKSRQLEI